MHPRPNWHNADTSVCLVCCVRPSHSGVFETAVQHMSDVIVSHRASPLNVARCLQISTKYSHTLKTPLRVSGRTCRRACVLGKRRVLHFSCFGPKSEHVGSLPPFFTFIYTEKDRKKGFFEGRTKVASERVRAKTVLAS